jgi:hypothetical protein
MKTKSTTKAELKEMAQGLLWVCETMMKHLKEAPLCGDPLTGMMAMIVMQDARRVLKG